MFHELQVHAIELDLQNEELRQAQVELEASQALYVELYDGAPVGYCTLSEKGLILQANRTTANLLGVTPGELVKQGILRFILREDQDTFHRHRQTLIATGEQRFCELRMVKQEGTIFWVHLHSRREPGTDGEFVCRTTFADITESKRVEEALQAQKDFFHLIAENLADFIAVLDLDGRRIYNSPSYQQFFGAPEMLRNTDSFADVHPDDRERVKQVFRETVQSGQGRQLEFRFLMADGSIRDMESRGNVIKDRDGRVSRVVVVSHDITERKGLHEQVRQMALHDPLTQLPNRRLLNDRLSQAIALSTRSGNYGALMFLDLDNFKPINDTYGHDVGDLVLIEAADRLMHVVREMDTVARVGGDEFVVLLSQLDSDQAESIAQAGIVAQKVRLILSEPYRISGADATMAETALEHQCTVSIGLTLLRPHEANPSDIQKRADAAMYQAKQAGGNQIRLSDDNA